MGYEKFDEYCSGIQELVEAKPITENDQDIREIRNGLLISLKTQELSEELASRLKKAIHEIFEEYKDKPDIWPHQNSIVREALYLLTPQLP